jgi:tumor protein p53-inducible protein 3
VKEHTENRGVDVVIDFIAAPYFTRNLEVLRTDGRLVILAFLGGVKPEGVNLVPVLTKRLQIIGTTLRSRSLEYKIELARDLYNFAWERFEEGRLEPVIDRVFALGDAAEAHRYMEEDKNSGKIVLTVE